MKMFQYFKRGSTLGKHGLTLGLVAARPNTKKQIEMQSAGDKGFGIQYIDVKATKEVSLPRDINVLVYDLDTSSEAAIDAFESFMQTKPEAIPVVVLVETIAEDVARWFLQMRVADWVRLPLTSGELIAACGRVLSHHASGRKDLKCYTFIGAKGGVGTTTIALHAAMALTKRNKVQSKVCLVDLDFASTSCADYLDLVPGWQLDELIADPSRLDSHMLNAMVADHRSGVSVLAAQRKFGETTNLSEELITRPMEMAIQRYGTLVVDLPRSSERWMGNVLAGSTDLYIVTEFTIPGLKLARRMVNQVVEEFGVESNPKVIVNKYSRSFFGSNFSSAEAKELLGPYLVGFVNSDEKLVSEAINRGVATTEIKPANHIFTSVKKIIGVSG